MESAADERKEGHSHVCPRILLFWVNSQKGFFFFPPCVFSVAAGVMRYEGASADTLLLVNVCVETDVLDRCGPNSEGREAISRALSTIYIVV